MVGRATKRIRELESRGSVWDNARHRMGWKDRKLPYIGSVYFRGSLPPRA